MAKLQDDPKVQELISKAAAKAVKEAHKNFLGTLKSHVASVAAETEDKNIQKALTGLGKSAAAALKDLAA